MDAMTGQEAVNVAQGFNEALDVDGVILTKLDGDARGGAALSIKSVVGKPIKFVGVGEKMDALEVFYPDRMASRILGMGDVLTLIEKAEAALDEKKARGVGKEAPRQQVRLRGLPGPDAADAEARAAGPDSGHDPRPGRQLGKLQGRAMDQRKATGARSRP